MKPSRYMTHVYDKDDHTLDTPCPQKWAWCRIHWWPTFTRQASVIEVPYPLELNTRSSRTPSGWAHVHVYCGPGAYLPKKPS